MSKTLTVDGEPVKYQIWDTAGQEKVSVPTSNWWKWFALTATCMGSVP